MQLLSTTPCDTHGSRATGTPQFASTSAPSALVRFGADGADGEAFARWRNQGEKDRPLPEAHPGDAFSFDIFSQVGAALKAAGGKGALGPLKPKHFLAIGESQSAAYLVTYVDAVDPLL